MTPSATKRPAPHYAAAHAASRSVARWHPTNRRQMAPHKRHPLEGIFGGENAMCTRPKRRFQARKRLLTDAICKMPFANCPMDRTAFRLIFAVRAGEKSRCRWSFYVGPFSLVLSLLKGTIWVMKTACKWSLCSAKGPEQGDHTKETLFRSGVGMVKPPIKDRNVLSGLKALQSRSPSGLRKWA